MGDVAPNASWKLDCAWALDPVPAELQKQAVEGTKRKAITALCDSLTSELNAVLGYRVAKIKPDRLDLSGQQS